MPQGLANWKRLAPNAGTAPLQGYNRLYTATSEGKFVALAVGMKQPVTLRARTTASFDIRNLLTGKIIKSVKVVPGDPIELSGYEELVIIGRGT